MVLWYNHFMSKIYFISGPNGVGKSTIIPYLQKMLPIEKYRVFDFDARGVPEDVDRKWRISEAKYWTDLGQELAKENISMIVCGFVKPADLSSDVDFIFLDIKPEILKERLVKRYTIDGIFDGTQNVIGKTVQEFIDGNLYILDQMRKMFAEKNSVIIDTSNLTPEEVAREVIKNI